MPICSRKVNIGNILNLIYDDYQKLKKNAVCKRINYYKKIKQKLK